jgi:hypothetical protein
MLGFVKTEVGDLLLREDLANIILGKVDRVLDVHGFSPG